MSTTNSADRRPSTAASLAENEFVSPIDLSEWEPLSPDVSEEELDRRAKSTEKRYTTVEILAHLEIL